MARLKRHHIFKVASVYAITAWVLIQLANSIFPDLGWPRQSVLILIVAVALLFPVVLVLAWMLIPPSKENPDKFTRWQRLHWRLGSVLTLVVVVLVTLSGAYLWFANVRHLKTEKTVAATTPVVTPAPLAATVIPAKSIAVLPFENLSRDPDNAYFANGMQDEILTKLAKIGALRVISRTSTEKYVSHPDDLKTIAQQLGVATILEGSVQKAGNQVLINVQLIDANTDVHLWAEDYQRSLDNIFGVEGEVAQAVADALNAKLTDAEKQVVASSGTQNPAALDAYLRGRALDNYGRTYSGGARAIDFYQQAVHDDPNYAQAWAALSIVMGSMYLNGSDAKRSTADAVRAAADTALRLQPDAVESLHAQAAYLYRVRRDYPAAREFYLRALQKQPGDVNVLPDIFYVERRMGLWNESIAHFREAIARDPRNVSTLSQGAVEVFMLLRRFDEARGLLMQALQVEPNDPTTHAILAVLEQRLGRLDAADVWLAKVPADSSDFYEREAIGQQLRYRRRYAELIARMAPVFREDESNWNDADFDVLIAAAWAERWSGHEDRARADFTQLAKAIDQRGGAGSAAQMNLFEWEAPLVYAGLGDWAKADAMSRQAIEFAQGDTIETALATWTRAVVLAQHGERDAAIAMLPGLLAMPAGPTPPLLALDPYWDPIRHDPRFQALLQQYAQYKPAVTYDAAPAAASS